MIFTRNKFIFKLFFVLFFALVVFTPYQAKAEEAIVVSPVRVEELVVPEQIITRSVKITNNSTSPKKIYAYLRDFTSGDEAGTPKLIVPGSVTGSFMSSWIKMVETSYDFQPGDTKEFVFNIEVPKNAGPGGYYGAIIFGTQAPDVRIDAEEKGAAIGVSQQAGSLILMQIAGAADENAIVRDFTTDKSFYSTPYSINFATRIENQGNVHVKPIGMIEISNMLGRKTAIVRVNEKGANILPKSIRKLETLWTGDFGFGKYKAELILSYGTPAESGGNGKQTLNSIQYFWIFPWKIIAMTVSGIAFLIAGLYAFLKIYKNKAIKSAMNQMGVGQEYYVRKQRGSSPAMHFGLTMMIILSIVFLLAAATYFLFFA